MNIVVLELENDKFFIEQSSKSAEEIYEAHCDGESECIFTQKYPPVSFVIESTNGTKSAFQEIIFSYMLDFGIDNVRGGEFDELFFTRERKNKIKEFIALKFEKCFNCLGNHRIKHCELTIDVNDDLQELIDEILAGDSSGDEKIGAEDMTQDEKLALELQMKQMRGESIDDEGGGTVNLLQITFYITVFVILFYAFIYFILSQKGDRKLKISFNTGYV